MQCVWECRKIMLILSRDSSLPRLEAWFRRLSHSFPLHQVTYDSDIQPSIFQTVKKKRHPSYPIKPPSHRNKREKQQKKLQNLPKNITKIPVTYLRPSLHLFPCISLQFPFSLGLILMNSSCMYSLNNMITVTLTTICCQICTIKISSLSFVSHSYRFFPPWQDSFKIVWVHNVFFMVQTQHGANAARRWPAGYVPHSHAEVVW